MADLTTLSAAKRDGRGSRAARRLRREGQIPGVMYGHKQDAVPLSVADDDLRALIRHGVRVVDLKIDGQTEKCLIKEIQWDALGKDILHVDFNRVSADERIRVTVPIVLRGTAPGVNAGGVLEQPLHALEIECLAISVPENIRVPIGELQLEQAIHIKDVKLPPGVTAVGDPDLVVVQVVKPVEELAAPTEPTEGPAEPEVIGRKAAEGEEEGE
jgi:large subunit ribosomal protein L25